MICKIFHRTIFLAAVLTATLFFACGGGGGGDDDDDRYTTTPAGSLTVSEFNSFKESHSSYFEDTGFANLIATFISGGSPASNGNTYYVSPNGSNSNNGSSSQAPFKTLPHAFSQLSAGDTLIVMDGTYTPGNEFELSCSGTSSAYITVKAQNKGKAVISCGSKPNNFALLSVSASFVMVDGLTFKDLRSNGGTGIRVENGKNHVVIANCTFTDIKTPTKASNTNHCTSNAIIGYGTSSSSPISSILIYKNKCYNMATGWSECISFTENCKYISIIDNYIDSTQNIGIDVGGNYEWDELPAASRFTRYAYIAHNTVANESTKDTYKDTCYGIYSDGGQHIQIIGNKVVNCMGGIEAGAEVEEEHGGYPTDDITISGNQIIDCQEVFFACGGYEEDRGWVKNVTFTGNTCTATRNADLMVNLAKCDTVVISGNTFTKTGSFEMEGIYREFSASYTKNITESNNTWIGF